MAKYKYLILPIALLIMAGIACNDFMEGEPESSLYSSIPTPANPLPKGDRILELDANAPEDQDFDRAMVMARELGAESIRLSVFWDDIETDPGTYNPDPNWLAIANQYYSAQKLAISLTISVLDTTETRLPADLEGISFSDPLMLDRFIGLLDYIKTQLVDVDLVYLAIGNEIDGVLGSDPDAWAEYRDFLAPSVDYAKELWPDLPISTKVTYDGFTGSMKDYALDMIRDSEVVMTTYYPLNSDFTVKNPDIILEDFQALVDLFPGKKILLTEIGYPSSKVIDSSPEKQAEFVHYMFRAWDEHHDQFTIMSYSWLSDLSHSSISEYESYYGLSSQGFGEFLRTLGLRTYTGGGEDKPGFDIFQYEANLRGW